ncbi:hypothetical protein ACFWUU_38135 [Kribbella sp. NPDC058693]|uniref:hypothetical protein n=1 Tax=Kribbella sp. NPDC058693 TaxID=3346602 RepID=UPI0036581C41
MSHSVEDALQQAGEALRRAVDVLRRRPADEVAAKSLVGEFHELRSLMSTAALLMKSFELTRFAAVSESGRDALDGADANLTAALAYLNQAAGELTAARQSLDSLL